jgi:hypothetical protein
MSTLAVSIIIPTMLANPNLLRSCLDSLSKLKTPAKFEVIIVGNVAEPTLNQFRKSQRLSYPAIWLALESNQGFAKAANAGIAKSQAEFIALLNDDAQVDQNWLSELLSVCQQSGADMVASNIYLADKKSLDSQGFSFAWRGKAEAITNHDIELKSWPDYWLNDNNRELFSSTKSQFWCEPFGPDAAACLFTRKLFDKIGDFNENFFAYLEDVELALRARQAGFHCALAEKAVVYHHKHASSAKISGFKAKQDFKNWWRIVVDTYPEKAWGKYWYLILVERLKNLSGLFKSRLH